MGFFELDFFSTTFLIQATLFVLILVVAWFSQFLLGRLFRAFERRLSSISWTQTLVVTAEGAVPPLIAWGLSQAAVQAFQGWGQNPAFLLGAAPLIVIWLLYRVIRNLLQANLTPAPARLWTRKVLLPVTLLAALLYLTGFLDDLLQVRAAGGQFQNITIGSILAGAALVIVFFVVARAIWRFLEHSFLPEAGTEAGLTHAIATLIGYSLIILGVIAGVVAMGVDLTALAVIAGGLSIGLGFGLQQLVSNLVSGYILMFEQSIEPGDIIELADTVGTVQHIGIRSIVIRTPHNKEVIIPNSYFLTEMMTNLTRTDRIVRVDIKIGVGYGVNPLEVEQALLAVAQHPRILDNPAPVVQFLDFGESSLDFALLVWTDDPAGIARLTSELRYRIWDSFKERNIEIPYPQREVHVRSIDPYLQFGNDPNKPFMDNDKDKPG